jgi:hypothetical protein
MAKSVAPPKNTAGGGFTFEDQVIAWLLAHMLAAEPLSDKLGMVERLDFQTRVDGWLLDDVLVTLTRDGKLTSQLPLSIKSNQQFSKSSAPAEFVTAAWEHFLHEGTTKFEPRTDFLGLVTSPLPPDVRDALDSLVNKAIAGDPKLLPTRLAEPGWANELERDLFKSFGCPGGLVSQYNKTEADTVRLIARLCFFEFDFEAVTSESRKQVVSLCRATLQSGDLSEAKSLSESLSQIVAARKSHSGQITHLQLLDELRGHFELKGRPDHAEDLKRLTDLSDIAAGQVAKDIGGRVRIDRTQALLALDDAIKNSRGIALVGPSGSGKSATGRLWFEQQALQDARTLWFDGQMFEQGGFAEFEAHLRLRHSLSELLSSVVDDVAVIVLDGLDHVFDRRAFDLIGALIRLLDLARENCPWRVVVICQEQEWPRVRDCLSRSDAGVKDWHFLQLAVVEAADLDEVKKEFPAVARLLQQSRLGPVLGNLKILDMVARRSAAADDVETAKWVGESSVAEWFWQSEVDRGEAGPTRAGFVLKLAEMQADRLRWTMPIDSFGVGELHPLGRLVEDRICRRTAEEHVGFEHDLVGDWARLRLLISHSSDIVSYLETEHRLDSPLWHRALRLLGLHFLEHRGDADQWKTLVSAFNPEKDGIARDLLLESAIIAADPAPHLETIAAALFSKDGELLRRLLTRFMAYATDLHPIVTMMAKSEDREPTAAESQFRYPIWRHWPPIVKFLHAHRAEVVAVAPVEIAKVVYLWLDNMPVREKFLRREAGELALAIGERAFAGRESHRGEDYEERDLYYRAALAAAPEFPDEVASFALRSSETAPDDTETDSTLPELADYEYFLAISDPAELAKGPWPGGPWRRIDAKFRYAVLDQGALIPLMRVRPAVARDVALATLIKPRLRFQLADSLIDRIELDVERGHRWTPPLYNVGPFLAFLRVDFREGLELIARLVEFATDRYIANAKVDDEQRSRREGANETSMIADLDRLVAAMRLPSNVVVVELAGERRTFAGDGHVFGWSAGHGTSPTALVCALMALEQYFYEALDGKRPIDQEIEVVLSRAKSVAFLKILIEVGKRELALFQGPLLPLLAVPEIYFWDGLIFHKGRSHLYIGEFLKGYTFARQAHAFHTLEHRKVDLQQLAQNLLFARPETQALIEMARQSWSERLAANPKDPLRNLLEGLIVLLDRAAYQPVEVHGENIVFVNAKAQELHDRHAAARRAAEDNMLVLTMPMRCRKWLDEGALLETDRLSQFWDQLQRIHALGSVRLEADASGRWPANFAHALAGGIAVLVCSHSAWLTQDAARSKWCRDLIAQMIFLQPAREEYDLPDSVLDTTWDCFLAEALAEIWKTSPADQEVRFQVSQLLFAPHYVAIKHLFRRCALNRAALGADFNRLRYLAFEAAQTRDRINFVHHIQRVPQPSLPSRTWSGRLLNRWPAWTAYRTRKLYPSWLSPKQVAKFHQSVDQWAREKLTAFAEGTTPAQIGPWSEIGPSPHFETVDKARAAWSPDHKFDFRYIKAAHEWMLTSPYSIDLEDRAGSLAFWRNALIHVLAPLSRPTNRSDYNHPGDEERWVLDGAAAAVLAMAPEDHPEELWSQILSLPEEADSWVEDFFRSLFRAALTRDHALDGFEKTVRAIFAIAVLRDDHGEKRWCRCDNVWDALIGIDHYTQSYWSEHHAALVKSLADLFEEWLAAAPSCSRRVATFAKWAERRAASPIRARATVWMEREIVRGAQSFDWSQAGDNIASLLDIAWRDDESGIRNDKEAFAAFRNLLQMLVNQQNRIALALVGRIGELGL